MFLNFLLRIVTHKTKIDLITKQSWISVLFGLQAVNYIIRYGFHPSLLEFEFGNEMDIPGIKKNHTPSVFFTARLRLENQ